MANVKCYFTLSMRNEVKLHQGASLFQAVAIAYLCVYILSSPLSCLQINTNSGGDAFYYGRKMMADSVTFALFVH